MHPAFSVILFTTLSGLGYGLAIMLSLGLLPPEYVSVKIGYFLALVLITAGLLSSTLHLGNPQRAWRAFSQWRSSWLSREGVLAVITYIPLTLQAFLVIFHDEFLPELGWLIVLLCLATVYCTGMIYASLKSVATWHTPLTPLNYVLFSLASGGLFFLLFASFSVSIETTGFVLVAMLVIAAWTAKWRWAERARETGMGTSTLASATGLGDLGKVRLLERPHVTENYLTNEMGFRVGRKHAGLLWRIALLSGFVVPVLAIAFSMPGVLDNHAGLLLFIGMLSMMIGLIVERWLFFATAKHVVSLYYDLPDAAE
ncbi:MAG: DmsC/YnfH family molybdoenzyme membrane anchor subunit [Pseudomonadota bacterium]